MKSWPALVVVLALVAVAVLARSTMRSSVIAWFVERCGSTRSGGRAKALTLFGGTSALAVAALAGGYACRTLDQPWGAGRFVAAALIIVGYLPIATLGAPKMTRWQKTFEQRLVLAGLAPDAAGGVASVAGPASALAVLLAVAAVPLLF